MRDLQHNEIDQDIKDKVDPYDYSSGIESDHEVDLLVEQEVL